MKNITYLIGAGASIQAIPVVNAMLPRMKKFRDFIFSWEKDTEAKKEVFKNFYEDLSELMGNTEQHTSVDAYMRELALSGDGPKLMRMKNVLICYLFFEQLKKPENLIIRPEKFPIAIGFPSESDEPEFSMKDIITSHDRRYNTFLGSLLDDSLKTLPKNVNILSWNYDMQFELAYSRMCTTALQSAQMKLQVFPSKSPLPLLDNSTLVKLNGTAGLAKKIRGEGFENIFNVVEDEFEHGLKYMLNFFEESRSRYHEYTPAFYFAWEKEKVTEQARELASKIMSKTNILVIIGYSFPDFNRLIDREILSKSNLEKIYIQVPEADFKFVSQNFLDRYPSGKQKVEHRVDLRAFYLPPEIDNP